MKKPTRKELIALLTWAAHHVGSAAQDHANDRDSFGFEKGQKRLEKVQKRLHAAAEFFPYPDGLKTSEWTND